VDYKQLLNLSLELWEYRNGILHGVTREDQRRKFTLSVHQQVQEAFATYKAKPTIISTRDAYLFERKTLAQRLQGDDDALLGWLHTVEVAIATQEVARAAASEQAARFFLPFRQAGALKQRALQPVTRPIPPLDTMADRTAASQASP
jgi:hypothetical protein